MKSLNILQQFLSIFIILISCNCIQSAEYIKEKPTFLPSCEIYQPEFEKCITNSMQILADETLHGRFPEYLQLIGSLEPMYLEHFIYRAQNDKVTVNATLSDIYIRGYSNVEVTAFTIMKEDFSFGIDTNTPLLRLESNINMEGRVHGNPFKLNNFIIIDMQNLRILESTETHLVEKDDLTFFDIRKLYIDTLQSKRFKVNKKYLFSNLIEETNPTDASYNVDPSLFKLTWEPLITELLEEIFLTKFKNAFDALPAKFLLSDIPKSTEFYDKKN